MKRKSPKHIQALINLLEDEDRHVSSMAMEQLLTLDGDVDRLIAEFQEAPNPVLRGRIHQLGNIVKLRRERTLLINEVVDGKPTVWDGILRINRQYNPQMNLRNLNRMIEELAARVPSPISTVGMATFMHNETFSFTGEDILGADLYLLEDVLTQHVGAPILLSVIAKHLGEIYGWNALIVLFKGKHCLYDEQTCDLVEPAEGWRVTRLNRDDKLHPCADRDIWLTILCQLFLSALLEGRLQTIHRIGSILSRLCGGEFSKLPFPLGS